MIISPPSATSSTQNRPPLGALLFAFAVLYTGYGLNFLAVRVGVEALPPFLFAGSHVFLAGVFLLLWQILRRQPVLLHRQGILRAATASLFLFVGGVGFVTLGESLGVPSGIAAVIKASAPLWVATLETLRPGGEKATPRMFLGLSLGAIGVVLMAAPAIDPSAANAHPLGTAILISSALLFAIGTIIIRHRPPCQSVITSVFYQMLLGGAYLLLIGLATGEASRIHSSDLTSRALTAFFFLLFIHSLGAFSAMNWLLRHLPASIVTTKFYVSPAVAVTAGWLVLGEPISVRIIGCMLLILAGVAILLLQGNTPPGKKAALRPDDADELEE